MNLSTKLNPASTALLVIDIQNDFCGPNGLMSSMGKDVSGMDMMIEKIKQLAALCEETGIPAFYTQQIYDRTKLTDLQKEQYDLDGKMITCDIDGDGYKFYKLKPPRDRIFPKYTYNVFSNANLSAALSSRGIRRSSSLASQLRFVLRLPYAMGSISATKLSYLVISLQRLLKTQILRSALCVS